MKNKKLSERISNNGKLTEMRKAKMEENRTNGLYYVNDGKKHVRMSRNHLRAIGVTDRAIKAIESGGNYTAETLDIYLTELLGNKVGEVYDEWVEVLYNELNVKG